MGVKRYDTLIPFESYLETSSSGTQTRELRKTEDPTPNNTLGSAVRQSSMTVDTYIHTYIHCVKVNRNR